MKYEVRAFPQTDQLKGANAADAFDKFLNDTSQSVKGRLVQVLTAQDGNLWAIFEVAG